MRDSDSQLDHSFNSRDSFARAPGGTSSSGPRVGKFVGDYQLVSELDADESSGGQLFLAKKAGLERTFALKLLPFDLEAAAFERLQREARLGSTVEHPGVVPVLEVGSKPAPYLVMDHVVGVSLAGRLAAAGGRIPWPEACRLLAEAGDAVGAAHAVGIVHCGLRPERLVIDGTQGQLRVRDFGLAKELGTDHAASLSRSLSGGSLPLYTAPEAFRGRVSPASDVYSLGAVLYQALTGRAPTRGSSPGEILQELQRGAPPLPSRLVNEVPAAVERACMQALAHDPGERFSSGRSFARALQAAVTEAAEDRADPVLLRTLALSVCGAWLVLAATLTLLAVRRTRELGELTARRERLVVQLQASSAASPRPAPTVPEQPSSGRRREAELVVDLERTVERQAEQELALREAVEGLERELRSLREERARPARQGGKFTEQLVALLQDCPGTQGLRALLLDCLGRYQRALEVLDEPSGPDPDPDLIVYRAHALGALQRGPELSRLLGELERQPRAVQSLYCRARFQSGLGPRQRQELLVRAGQTDPSKGYVYAALVATPPVVRGASDLDRLEQSLEVAERGLALRPADASLYYHRSAARYHRWLYQGKRDEELLRLYVADLRRARQFAITPTFWTYMGKTWLSLVPPRPAAALPELKVALELAERDAPPQERALARAWLGVARHHLGERERAYQIWLEGLRIGPDTSGAYELLALLKDLPRAEQRSFLARVGNEEVRRRLTQALGVR